METRTYNVYEFDELSKEQQQKVLDKYYDINVDHDWWEFVYSDAEDIGLKILAFDIGSRWEIDTQTLQKPKDIAFNILESHGKHCDTYKVAKYFLVNRHNLKKYRRQDGLKECEMTFEGDLKQEYLRMLERDYNYLTSEEAVKETLIANEYMFTETGRID
jgi:hypothetical protein